MQSSSQGPHPGPPPAPASVNLPAPPYRLSSSQGQEQSLLMLVPAVDRVSAVPNTNFLLNPIPSVMVRGLWRCSGHERGALGNRSVSL